MLVAGLWTVTAVAFTTLPAATVPGFVEQVAALWNWTAAPVAKVVPETLMMLVPAAGPLVWLRVAVAAAKLGVAVPTTIVPATASAAPRLKARPTAMALLMCIRWFSSTHGRLITHRWGPTNRP